MERTKISRAIAWALLSSGVAVSGAAYAADSAKSTSSPTDRGVQSRSAGTDRQATQQQGDRFWASDLIGKNVQLSGGKDGEIKDVIVDAKTGEVRHVVTEIDTDRGKDGLYAVPARMFQLGKDNKLTLNVDQSWLAQRKPFTEDKWPAMQDKDYWGDTQAGDNAHRLSKLIGQNVHNAEGKQVGEIEDAVVNLKSQKVDFVVFSHDPGVTKAEKDYALPLASLQIPTATADGGEGKQRIVLNMSDEKLKGMKSLEDADRKRINDPAFMSRFQAQ
ncbi:MAG TPA: PRC-barrel domain-containing protein [Burkholderiales bacterium]|nr:PRC-barrel domain-containing protein [Burkholderiales bacterium]